MSGRAEAVERLIQVLSVLRAADGQPVPRSRLVERVTAYGASTVKEASLKKTMQNDVRALLELGFDVEPVAADGDEGAWVLHSGDWRLPVDLTPEQEALLPWVMAAAGAAAEATGAPDVSGLIGTVPRSLDTVQAALAGRRRVRVVRDGEEVELEPAQLASRHGRWFVLGRYPESRRLLGHRLDRLDVVGLGGPVTGPVDVGDPEEVLDPTAWHEHEQRETELRCRVPDLDTVRSWFPRADVAVDGEDAVLRFSYRNEDALVTRVLGLAWHVRVVSPESAVRRVREQAAAVLEAVR